MLTPFFYFDIMFAKGVKNMNNIKKFRLRECKTQVDIANCLGCCRQSVNFFERGSHGHKLPIKQARKLADFLNCNPFELLGDENFALLPENDVEIEQLIYVLTDRIQNQSVKERIISHVQAK